MQKFSNDKEIEGKKTFRTYQKFHNFLLEECLLKPTMQLNRKVTYNNEPEAQQLHLLHGQDEVGYKLCRQLLFYVTQPICTNHSVH